MCVLQVLKFLMMVLKMPFFICVSVWSNDFTYTLKVKWNLNSSLKYNTTIFLNKFYWVGIGYRWGICYYRLSSKVYKYTFSSILDVWLIKYKLMRNKMNKNKILLKTSTISLYKHVRIECINSFLIYILLTFYTQTFFRNISLINAKYTKNLV